MQETFNTTLKQHYSFFYSTQLKQPLLYDTSTLY